MKHMLKSLDAFSLFAFGALIKGTRVSSLLLNLLKGLLRCEWNFLNCISKKEKLKLKHIKPDLTFQNQKSILNLIYEIKVNFFKKKAIPVVAF